jgi:hypothetical protein
MSEALPGEHYCEAHQGNHSHYDPMNCSVCRLQRQLESALERAEAAEADARRYQYIRDHQYWQRSREFDLIGLRFENDNGFTALVYLDYAIDNLLRGAKPFVEPDLDFEW